MDRAGKAQVIGGIKEKADKAQITVLTDFKGMTVEEMTELRVKLRDKQVDYVVVKNTLARIAFTGGPHDVLKEKFKEHTGVAFGFDDPVVAAKTLADFAKGSKKFSVKSGSLEGKLLSEPELVALSKLPGKPEMLAMMLGTLNAVPGGFVSLLANVPRGFLNVLTALKDKKAEAA